MPSKAAPILYLIEPSTTLGAYAAVDSDTDGGTDGQRALHGPRTDHGWRRRHGTAAAQPGARERDSLEEKGAVSQRATVGRGPRRLQRGRQGAGVLQPGPSSNGPRARRAMRARADAPTTP